MVEKGHEARVMMMLNDKVVMHMYDKDYSGNNERWNRNIEKWEKIVLYFRFAMFGQSIIVEMKVNFDILFQFFKLLFKRLEIDSELSWLKALWALKEETIISSAFLDTFCHLSVHKSLELSQN